MSLMQTFRDGGYRPACGWKRVVAWIYLTVLGVGFLSIIGLIAGPEGALLVLLVCTGAIGFFWAIIVLASDKH